MARTGGGRGLARGARDLRGTEPAFTWISAGGEHGGIREAETFLLIGNVSDVDGTARVTMLFDDRSPSTREVLVPGRSRVTLPMRPEEGWPVSDESFAVLVESVPGASGARAEFVVERATYSNAGRVIWAAGESTLATPVE